jgi:hypothetical protein
MRSGGGAARTDDERWGGRGADSAAGSRRAVPEGWRRGGRRSRVAELSPKVNGPTHGGRGSRDTRKEEDIEKEAVVGGSHNKGTQ